MPKITTCPNECFRASNAITSLITAMDDYEAVWYLTRTQKELDSVVDAFKTMVGNKNKDLIEASRINIPEDAEAETKASMIKARQDAKDQLDDVYLTEGDKERTIELHLIPHSKLWGHIPPERRPVLRHLLTFMTTPEGVE